jgi:6-phosphogluconolactonase
MTDNPSSLMTDDPPIMTSPSIQIRRFPSRAELETALEERLREAITQGGAPAGARASVGPQAASGTQTRVAVMLSGGSTPLPAYRSLAARTPKPAAGLRVLFSDDRYVPSSEEASNFHQTLPLIEALALPENSVLRVRTELPLEKAAEDYERRLDVLRREGGRVSFGLLGLGADGHTASLFNAEDIQRARGRRAVAVNRPDGMQAVSVSPEVLGWFDELVFIVAGADKHNAVQSLLNGDTTIAATLAIAGRAQTQLWLAET